MYNMHACIGDKIMIRYYIIADYNEGVLTTEIEKLMFLIKRCFIFNEYELVDVYELMCIVESAGASY